jgi:hypothetical protein
VNIVVAATIVAADAIAAKITRMKVILRHRVVIAAATRVTATMAAEVTAAIAVGPVIRKVIPKPHAAAGNIAAVMVVAAIAAKITRMKVILRHRAGAVATAITVAAAGAEATAAMAAGSAIPKAMPKLRGNARGHTIKMRAA